MAISYADYADIDALRIEHYPPLHVKHRGALVMAGVVLVLLIGLALLALRLWRQRARSRVLLVQLKAKKSGGVFAATSRVQFMTSSETPLLPPV